MDFKALVSLVKENKLDSGVKFGGINDSNKALVSIIRAIANDSVETGHEKMFNKKTEKGTFTNEIVNSLIDHAIALNERVLKEFNSLNDLRTFVDENQGNIGNWWNEIGQDSYKIYLYK